MAQKRISRLAVVGVLGLWVIVAALGYAVWRRVHPVAPPESRADYNNLTTPSASGRSGRFEIWVCAPVPTKDFARADLKLYWVDPKQPEAIAAWNDYVKYDRERDFVEADMAEERRRGRK